jgi:O-antigen ligase
VASANSEKVSYFLAHRAPEVRRTLLRALVVGVPIFFFRGTNDPFAVPKLSLLMIGLSVIAGLRVAEALQGAKFQPTKRIVIPVAVIVVPLLIGWLFGPYKYWSLFGEYGRFQGLVPYLLLALFGLLAAEAFAGRLRDLAWPLVVGGAIAGGYSVLQFLGIDLFEWAQQFGGEATQTSTIGNPNFTGGFLAIVLPVAIGLWMTEEERPARALQLGVLVLAGLILSFSQGAWGAAVGGCVVVGAYYMKGRFSWAPLAAAAIVLLLVIGGVGRVAQTMSRVDVDGASTTQLRALWWQGALNMAAEYPITGRGPNAYAVEAPQHRTKLDAQVMGFDTSNDPHSVPLSFLTSAGILGLLGFLALGGWVFWRGRDIAGADEPDLLATGFLGGAAAYFVQSVVAVDEITVRFGLWTCIAGVAAASLPIAAATKGQSAARKKNKSRAVQVPRLRNGPWLGAAAVTATVAAWWGFNFLVTDARFRHANELAQTGRADEAVAEFDEVTGGRGAYQYRHNEGFYLGQFAVALEREDNDGEVLLEQALDAYSYLDGFPSVPALRDRSKLLRSYAELDPLVAARAAASYEETLALDPFNVTLATEAVEAMSFAEEWELLVAAIEPDIDDLGGRAPSLYAYLALAYAQLGEAEDARSALTALGEAAGSDPVALEAQEILGGDSD